jgi:serine/threonine-protein kinase RsbW
MTASWHMAIPAEFTAIDEARTWAAGHARAAGFDAEAVADLELAMTEALANVVEHGGEGGPAVPIDVEASVVADRLVVRIRDRSATFVASDVPARDLDHVAEGGYGLPLIGMVMDEVRRAPRGGGGNILTLVKFRRGPTDG